MCPEFAFNQATKLLVALTTHATPATTPGVVNQNGRWSLSMQLHVLKLSVYKTLGRTLCEP